MSKTTSEQYISKGRTCQLIRCANAKKLRLLMRDHCIKANEKPSILVRSIPKQVIFVGQDCRISRNVDRASGPLKWTNTTSNEIKQNLNPTNFALYQLEQKRRTGESGNEQNATFEFHKCCPVRLGFVNPICLKKAGSAIIIYPLQ